MSAGWADDAACRGMDPAIFLNRGQEDKALAVCAACPVVAECLDEAERTGADGVRGGKRERDRRNGGMILARPTG